MRHPSNRLRLCSIILAMVTSTSLGGEPTNLPTPTRKVLVELFSSQNDILSPQASDLLIKLEKLGYGSERVISINFHVDDRDEPWVDIFAHPFGSARLHDYQRSLSLDDFRTTPLFLVDGHEAIVGLSRLGLVEALDRAECRESGVKLSVSLSKEESQIELHARIEQTTSTNPRDLLISLALAEVRTSTKVLAGDNAGRRLYEHQVVQRLWQKPLLLEQKSVSELSFPIKAASRLEASRFRLVVIIQDRESGIVDQADSIEYPVESKIPDLIVKKRLRKSNRNFGLENLPSLGASVDPTRCPDCGTPLSNDYLALFPPGIHPRNRTTLTNVPPPEC